MIIESLCNMLYTVITAILSFINVPEFDPEFITSFESMLSLVLDNAGSLISLFVPWRAVQVGFPVVLVLLVIRFMYPVVMWILRKIPMLGVS